MSALVNDLQRDFSLREGLHTCGIFHMLYRRAGDVLGANVFTSCNQPGIVRTDGLRTFATSSQRAFELYRNHSGTRAVRCEEDCPTSEMTRQGNVTQLPYLDAVATASDDGSRLFIHVVNRHLHEAIKADVSVKEFAPAKQGVACVLTGDSWNARNSFSHPNYVNIREEALSNLGPNFEYTFPPHSAVTIELRAER
jgi:alpha-L-arabinofuranosidase